MMQLHVFLGEYQSPLGQLWPPYSTRLGKFDMPEHLSFTQGQLRMMIYLLNLKIIASIYHHFMIQIGESIFIHYAQVHIQVLESSTWLVINTLVLASKSSSLINQLSTPYTLFFTGCDNDMFLQKKDSLFMFSICLDREKQTNRKKIKSCRVETSSK